MSNEATGMNGAAPADPAELRAEIARTRKELGETATALVAKTDVKARIRSRVAATVRRPVPVAMIAAVASAAAVAFVLFRHSRR